MLNEFGVLTHEVFHLLGGGLIVFNEHFEGLPCLGVTCLSEFAHEFSDVASALLAGVVVALEVMEYGCDAEDFLNLYLFLGLLLFERLWFASSSFCHCLCVG